MILGPREMEVFRQVMESGGVTAAARALGLSQPAVSKTLQQMEERLGFRLFTRQRKRLVPTSEADALLPEVAGASAALDVVRRLAGDLRAGRTGLLRLAVAPSLAHGLAPLAVAAFRAQRPEAVVNLRVAPALEAQRLVLDHRVDLGLVLGPAGDPRLVARELASRPLGCVLPGPDHPLAARCELRVADLAGHAVVSVSRQLPAGELVARLFEEANLPLRLAAETNQSAVALGLARAGVGVAVLEGFAVEAARAQGMETRLLLPATPLAARLLSSRQRPLSKMAEAFAEVLADCAAAP